MRLLELTTRGFRNLSPDVVSFGPGWNLVVGENGQGKTNLLEAVALVCGQRSFRRASPTDMSAEGESFAIEGKLRRGFATEDLSVEWSRDAGRRFRRSGKEISFREASALAPAVFLAPEHRALVTGPPEARRRFLDRLLLGYRPAAGADLAAYDRALKERNALLSAIARRSQPPHSGPFPKEEGGVRGASSRRDRASHLEAWTEELARAGEAVRRHRREALAAFSTIFSELAKGAGKEYAEISISYLPGESSDLLETLEKMLPIERLRGRSLAGPHRDDLLWSRASRPLEGLASAGEVHRLVTLAKLAEWRVVKDTSGEAPLFGVDDFDAGLSARSLDRFFAGLPEGTTVVLTTASDASRLPAVPATVLRMSGGRTTADGTTRATASNGI